MPMTPSMRADNHYTFLCPMTLRKERYIACMFRRHKHWRGERIEGDCATCMNAGKCPALKMLDREWREEKAVYFDAVPGRVRKLPEEVVKQIENKLVRSIHAFGTGVDRSTLERLMEHKIRDAVFAGVQTCTIVPEFGDDHDAAVQPKSRARISRAAQVAAESRAQRMKLAASRPQPKVVAKPAKEGSLVDAIAGANSDMAEALNQAIANGGAA